MNRNSSSAKTLRRVLGELEGQKHLVVLSFLLARELGTVNYEDVDALADKIVERSDGIAVKYRNLWK